MISNDLLNFCAIYEAQDADNATMCIIWFVKKPLYSLCNKTLAPFQWSKGPSIMDVHKILTGCVW